jgi:putative phosphoribosyl transferase
MELHSPVVLALPRGGVPVAAEIATERGAPMEVFVARKVSAPGHEELGIGAVAEGSDEVVVSDAARQLGIGDREMQRLAARAHRELDRRVALYRGDRSLPELAGREVVLFDDGLATGVTAEAALRSLRLQAPARLILAVPVCARATAARLGAIADEVVCVEAPAQRHADRHIRSLRCRRHAGVLIWAARLATSKMMSRRPRCSRRQPRPRPGWSRRSSTSRRVPNRRGGPSPTELRMLTSTESGLGSPAVFTRAVEDLVTGREARRPNAKHSWPASPARTRTGRRGIGPDLVTRNRRLKGPT